MIFYSAAKNAFFDSNWKDLYVSSGTWPDDCVEITPETYAYTVLNRQADKTVVPGEDGYPVLADYPSPTCEQMAAIAVAKRDELISVASKRIAFLQDAVDIGETTAAEEQQLLAWKKYRVALNRITEQPGFPTVIEWPDVPSV